MRSWTLILLGSWRMHRGKAERAVLAACAACSAVSSLLQCSQHRPWAGGTSNQYFACFLFYFFILVIQLRLEGTNFLNSRDKMRLLVMQNGCLLTIATQPSLPIPVCCFKLKWEVCILDTFMVPRTIGLCFTLWNCCSSFHFCHTYTVLSKYPTEKYKMSLCSSSQVLHCLKVCLASRAETFLCIQE